MGLALPPKRKKGFVLTTDSILAMGFAIGLIAYLSYVSSTGSSVFPHAVEVQNYAEDLGNVLDESGLLNSVANSSNVTSANSMMAVMSNTIPGGANAQVSANVYQYVPSGSCPANCTLAGNSTSNGFCLCKTVLATLSSPANSNDSNASFIGSANRVFYTDVAGTDYFGLAQVTAWVK